MIHVGQDIEEHRILQLFVRVHQPLDTENDELVVRNICVTVEEFSFRAFAHRIDSNEWQYDQILMNVSKVDEMFCRFMMTRINEATDGEQNRGIMVYLYCGKTSERDIPIVIKLIKTLELQKLPIVFCLLRDDEEK